MKRRFLVFVRAGDDSLHPDWLRQDPERVWDCFVSYYGRERRTTFGGEYFAAGGVNKFEHLQHLMAARARSAEVSLDGIDEAAHARIGDYDYVCVADPDLEVGAGDLSRLFLTVSQHRLALAQPSLTPDSFWSYPLTLHNPHYSFRRTNFVEVMCPVFSRAALQACAKTFGATVSTWGLDYLWPQALGRGAEIGIVDAVQVRHAKPVDVVNGPWYEKLRALGVDAHTELAGVIAKLEPRDWPRYFPWRSQPAPGNTRLSAYLKTTNLLRRIERKVGRLPRRWAGSR